MPVTLPFLLWMGAGAFTGGAINGFFEKKKRQEELKRRKAQEAAALAEKTRRERAAGSPQRSSQKLNIPYGNTSFPGTRVQPPSINQSARQTVNQAAAAAGWTSRSLNQPPPRPVPLQPGASAERPAPSSYPAPPALPPPPEQNTAASPAPSSSNNTGWTSSSPSTTSSSLNPFNLNVNNFIAQEEEKEEEEEEDFFSPSSIAQALLRQTMQGIFSQELPNNYG